ncbi:MAG: hypothetical protein RH942_07830 [Kiloniellaceae bacterium]
MEKPNPLYSWALQAWAPLRWAAGILLIIGGVFGFLPALGFWMIPLGILFLASGVPWVRSLAKAALRRLRAWLGRDGAAGAVRQRPRK